MEREGGLRAKVGEKKKSKGMICSDWRASVLLDGDLTSNGRPAASRLISK